MYGGFALLDHSLLAKTMVPVLHANLISCRVGFVLSCFYKRNLSCSMTNRELKNHDEVHDDDVC